MEMAMNSLGRLEPITLAARNTHRIENGKGLEVACLRGVAWVTQANDERDIILSAGQSFVLDRRGVAVVYALKDVALTVAAAWQMPAKASVPVRSHAEMACA
jgi:hypothetical protein